MEEVSDWTWRSPLPEKNRTSWQTYCVQPPSLPPSKSCAIVLDGGSYRTIRVQLQISLGRLTSLLSFFLLWFYSFFLREGKGERKKGRAILMFHRNINWQPLRGPQLGGPGLQPQHVPCPEIKPATFQLVGQWPIHWATPVRATFLLFDIFSTGRQLG